MNNRMVFSSLRLPAGKGALIVWIDGGSRSSRRRRSLSATGALKVVENRVRRAFVNTAQPTALAAPVQHVLAR